MKTGAFADCRRFAMNITAAGGKLPQPLANLIQAHSVLANSTPPAGPTTGPESSIVDAALDGTLSAERLAELLPAAALQRVTLDYARTLAADTERVLLMAWHRAMENGGADAVLTSMRPRFEKHAKEIAKARSLFSWDSDPETVLASGDPRVVEAWSGLEEHLTAVAKIVLVAREFGCKLSAQFPQIVPYTAGNSVAISDEALMCASGNLEVESSYFARSDRGHRSSPLFRVLLTLHTVASARERYRLWAAGQWDNLHGGPRGGRVVEGEFIEDPAPVNPYAKV